MRLTAEEKASFFNAAERNNLTAVKYYVEEERASLFSINEDHETLAHIAAKNGYTDLLKYVLKKEPLIVAEKDRLGNSAFFLANQMGAVGIVRYMIEEHGAAIWRENDKKFLSFTLHTAAQGGHLATLKYFLEEKQSDVNILNNRRESLLYTAVEYKHHDIVKYLVEKRHADVELFNVNHANVIFPTVATDDLPLMKYFFDERKVPIDVNWQDKFGNALIHRAAFMNRTEIMRYLVDEKHADFQLAGHEKRTPLHYAASRGCYEICTFLIEHGASTQVKDDAGRTPLESAFDRNLIQYLRSVTSAHRNRRSLPLVQIMAYNQQSSLSTGPSLAGGAPSLFSNYLSPRLQDFLVIVAEFLFPKTRRLPADTGSDTLWSPSHILRERMDPTAIASVYDFDEK